MNFQKFMHLVNSGKMSCGKIRYDSQQRANDALKQARKDRLESKNPTHSKIECRAYLCNKCDGYHLTSKEDKFAKSREEQS